MRDRATRWSLPKRLVFLISAVFLGLTAAPILLALLPWIGDVFPPAYEASWNVAVVWLGERVLGLPGPITLLHNNSGDTTWNYVQMFGIVMISVIVGSAWAVADRARDDYAAVHHWLRVLVRYALSGALMVYGLAKLFCLQFSEPGLATLTQTYGEASPTVWPGPFSATRRPTTCSPAGPRCSPRACCWRAAPPRWGRS